MNQEKSSYQSPQIEVIEIAVEQGFATSSNGFGGDGGNNNPL